jgi:hypothetical protein
VKMAVPAPTVAVAEVARGWLKNSRVIRDVKQEGAAMTKLQRAEHWTLWAPVAVRVPGSCHPLRAKALDIVGSAGCCRSGGSQHLRPTQELPAAAAPCCWELRTTIAAKCQSCFC